MADRISTLPDELLHHILSFVPTQDAVSTSMLSKRWKPLWRSIPSLYFDDQTYLQNSNKPYDCFSKFIYRTILTRDAHQPITSFRLHCDAPNFDIDESDLNVWVNNIMQRGLENLHIQLPVGDEAPSLSSCIFSCKTLVVLKLIKIYVDASPNFDLPSLKTLHLSYVDFPDREYLCDLLSGCPILEDMDVTDMFYVDDSTPDNKYNFKSLSKLVRADIFAIYLIVPLKSISNVEFLRLDQFLDDDIPVFPNLTHLELVWGWDMDWHLVFALLNKCPKLQMFVLDILRSPTDVVWISPCGFPVCLSSQLRKCSIKNYGGTESELHFAKYIMQNSRVLRKMIIYTDPSLKLEDKFEMLKELSLFPTACELLFE